MGGSWYIRKVIIDSNEKKRGIRAYNYYINTYEVNVKPLDYGDYLFLTSDGKKAIFEFKTCEDFISSMENKSLFQELSNQTINNEYSYLIICGNWEDSFDYLYFNVSHYRYKYKTKRMLNNRLTNQINGAIQRIYAMYIPIIFAENEEDAFSKMLKISSKIADSKKYGGVVRPSHKHLEITPVEYFLSGIDGIGEKKSKNITDELGLNCLEDLCEKKPSDFLSVHYINEKNVKEIWKRIHNEELEL